MELVVLKQMNWSLTPRTANAWSKLILQVDGRINNSAAEKNNSSNQSVHSLIKPSYCGLTHSKIMHLVDLCMLDINALNFSYASLAASASYFVQESPLPPGNYFTYVLFMITFSDNRWRCCRSCSHILNFDFSDTIYSFESCLIC